jgi:CHASE2 domain-containing sensor protein
MKLAVGGPGVPPPDILADSPERIGFADQVMDRDGVIRRGLLFASDDEATYYSLSLQLALSYLEPLGILPQPDKKNPEHLQLGSVTIRPFESSDGPYVDADSAGYQFLLDYKGPTRFRTFSLDDVKSGRVDEQAIKDKIVLVGQMADSVKDYVDIPTKSNLYGVEMQAICADQLLRIALHGQRPTCVLSNWQESLWIVASIALGGILGVYARSTRVLLLMGGIGLTAIGAAAYVLFCLGWWFPVVPTLMGCFVAWLLAGLHESRKRRRV